MFQHKALFINFVQLNTEWRVIYLKSSADSLEDMSWKWEKKSWNGYLMLNKEQIKLFPQVAPNVLAHKTTLPQILNFFDFFPPKTPY